MSPKHPLKVVIVGAGLSGITLGIELQRRGISSFTLYEKDAADVGGTWRDNTYPSCACDVPSHCELYSCARRANLDLFGADCASLNLRVFPQHRAQPRLDI